MTRIIIPRTFQIGRARFLAVLFAILVFLGTNPALAHVGNPNVVFEGRAGEFPIRVHVKPPGVVPGLAEISVRVLEGEVRKVTVLPLHWKVGRAGAPSPDIAQPVPGGSNLFSAQLWLMTQGAYGVEVEVSGPRGRGTITVPVNSLANNRLPLQKSLQLVLVPLAIILVLLLVSIHIAAAREGTLAPGMSPGVRENRRAALSGILCAGLVIAMLVGGNAWWREEDRYHDQVVVYRRPSCESRLYETNGIFRLRIEWPDRQANGQARPPLIPEHGKLVHLFLFSNQAPFAMAHLHPEAIGATTYDSNVPSLPPGSYRLIAEITEETGLAHSLTNSIELPEIRAPGSRFHPTDPDDSWEVANFDSSELISGPESEVQSGGLEVVRRSQQFWHGSLCLFDSPVSINVNEVSKLTFYLQNEHGLPTPIQPYMGMLGHLIVHRADSGVFTHVHPAGSISMAAAKRLAGLDRTKAALMPMDAFCGDLSSMPPNMAEAMGRSGELSFPCVFPTRGVYDLWLQVKTEGKIRTLPWRIKI